MSSSGTSRRVTKRDIISAIVMFFLVAVPFELREIYPNSEFVQTLFGGFRLLFYWMLILYLGWRFDRWLNMKLTKKKL